jgi:hypothetical protein
MQKPIEGRSDIGCAANQKHVEEAINLQRKVAAC